MGVIEGKEDLLDLLDRLDVNNFIVLRHSGLLGKCFKDEIPLKILRGEKLTESEDSFERITSLHICSMSTEAVEGLKRVHEWFESKKALPADS